MIANFCNFTSTQTAGLEEAFNTVFQIADFRELWDVYDVFKNDFPGSTVSTPQGIKRQRILLKTNQTTVRAQYLDLQFQIGIDVPVLLSPNVSSDNTVFIVAEDALRDFKSPSDDVRLATPFGLHMEFFRSTKLRVYWRVIENLLSKGFNVYVTDIHKLWLKSEGKPKVDFKGDVQANFYSAFHKEIQVFNPRLIITYGKPAAHAVDDMKTSIKTLHFPHPTGTANGEWKKRFAEYYQADNIRCTEENKISFINLQLNNTTHNIGFPQ